MQLAIDTAKAAEGREFKIGAVIANQDGVVIATTTKLMGSTDITAHAEMVAIRKACEKLGTYKLEGCTLYSTLEPCPMCAGAAVWARLGAVVFGATIEDAQGKLRQITVPAKKILDNGDPQVQLVEGFMREECKELLS